jgi:hypothetical protein
LEIINKSVDERCLDDWTARWKMNQKRIEKVVRRRTDPGGKATPKDTPLNKAVLKLRSKLGKEESSVLVQVPMGRIRRAKFLYSRKVPSALTA